MWDQYNISWKLEPEVNVLIGPNGSGKSTILRLLNRFLNDSDFCKKDRDILKTFKITFDTGRIVEYPSANRIPIRNFLNTSYVSTFDKAIDDLPDPERRTFGEYLANELEEELSVQIDRFYRYEAQQSERFEVLKSQGIDSQKKQQELQHEKDLLITLINQIFEKTNKIFDSFASDPSNHLIFRQNSKLITSYQLSSGEKQILVILLQAINQLFYYRDQPRILLMDEPEISLHLVWQEQLIDIIRQLNPHSQLIIATHSPAIVMKGWLDRVIEIERIMK